MGFLFKSPFSPSPLGVVPPQQTQNICITFVQRRTNVFDVGPALYKCYRNVLWLLGHTHLFTCSPVNRKQARRGGHFVPNLHKPITK